MRTANKWLRAHGFTVTRYGEERQYLKAVDKHGTVVMIQHRKRYNVTIKTWDFKAKIRVELRQGSVPTMMRLIEKYVGKTI